MGVFVGGGVGVGVAVGAGVGVFVGRIVASGGGVAVDGGRGVFVARTGIGTGVGGRVGGAAGAVVAAGADCPDSRPEAAADAGHCCSPGCRDEGVQANSAYVAASWYEALFSHSGESYASTGEDNTKSSSLYRHSHSFLEKSSSTQSSIQSAFVGGEAGACLEVSP